MSGVKCSSQGLVLGYSDVVLSVLCMTTLPIVLPPLPGSVHHTAPSLDSSSPPHLPALSIPLLCCCVHFGRGIFFVLLQILILLCEPGNLVCFVIPLYAI